MSLAPELAAGSGTRGRLAAERLCRYRGMVIVAYRELAKVARRWSARSEDVDDVVQDSLLAAHTAGKSELRDAADLRWVASVIRNKARLEARSAVRRRRRDDQWYTEQLRGAQPKDAQQSGQQRSAPVAEALDFSELPPALRAVARLASCGLDRREISHLLGLTDEVLRKRISTLGKRLAGARGAVPEPDRSLTLGLAYGRIRQALLTALRRRQGHFATHDPDGHLLIIRQG
jgi:RNA polymerase sigma factor (sigma-70 family)